MHGARALTTAGEPMIDNSIFRLTILQPKLNSMPVAAGQFNDPSNYTRGGFVGVEGFS